MTIKYQPAHDNASVVGNKSLSLSSIDGKAEEEYPLTNPMLRYANEAANVKIAF